MKTLAISSVAFLLSFCPVRADVFDFLGLRANKSTNQPAPGALNLNSLSQDQMIQGLKEALGQGVQQAVRQLGQNGGFLTNLDRKSVV